LSREHILVTSSFDTPFIAQDITLLRRHYAVTHLISSGRYTSLAIAAAIRHADLVYSWFASTHAAAAVFLARRRGIPSMIALGGADVARFPDLGYGIWNSPWRSRLVTYALRNADRILAVDPYLKEQAALRARYDGRNIEVLPTGFDAGMWTAKGRKKRTVLTVAACDTEARMKIKGIDLLCEAASRLPEVSFLLVGIADGLMAGLRARVPPNMEVRVKTGREELLRLYRSAKVYCQPSVIEGLPGAVCEAMLCGCVPVGTDVGGMQSAIDGAGYLVSSGNVKELVQAISKALRAPPAMSARARSLIRERFTLRRREEGLISTIRQLLQ
jgi:glycosyltransferase involved in cell wall biosynthesis